MKALLMYPDRDFDLDRDLPPNEPDLNADLELGVMLRAMADGDEFLYATARQGLHCGLTDPAEIVYRQHVLAVWVPITLSPHATWAYSWIKPPSRSRRSTRIFVPAAGGCERPAGGFCCSAQRRLTRSACQRSRIRGEMIRRSRQPSPSF
jgi:hypothetical protein